MTYAESMLRYGNDKPDTRFGMEIHDVGALLSGSDFKVFEGVLDGGGVVRAINAGRARDVAVRAGRLERRGPDPRRQGGRADRRWARATRGRATWRSSSRLSRSRRSTRSSARPRATCCCSSPTRSRSAAAALGGLRLELGQRFGLIPEGAHDVLWIVDPPMFEATGDAKPALDRDPPPVHGADDDRLQRPGRDGLPRLRPRARRRRDRRRLDPHPRAGGPGAGLRRPRHGPGGGRAPLRLPAARAEAGRAAPRRHRDGHRPHRRDPRRPRLDPRRHRLPEDRLRRRPAHRRRRRRWTTPSSRSWPSSPPTSHRSPRPSAGSAAAPLVSGRRGARRRGVGRRTVQMADQGMLCSVRSWMASAGERRRVEPSVVRMRDPAAVDGGDLGHRLGG